MGDRKIYSIRFNQDHGCFTASMENGVRIYNVEPLVEKSHYDVEAVGSVASCEMLFRTNIWAIIPGGMRPKVPENILQFYDESQKKAIMEIKFAAAVKSVRFRRDKLVVVLPNRIHLFSFLQPTRELFSVETRANPKGLCEITPLQNSHRQILVFPGHKLGSVQIMELSSTFQSYSSAPVYLQAHKNELACIAINQQGKRIATASEQGTLIRVWDTSTRNHINFSTNSDFLCCSSDKGTVHIFAIKDTNLNKRLSAIPTAFIGTLGKYGDSQWALTNFTVSAESACVCAFGPNNTIYALCFDGTFHKYAFSAEGICHSEGFEVFLDVDDDDDRF
ncbi:hypothetical protein HUJ05_001876 [Dendroctonus ponderosae]|nr:hypothetical protein HUJ05_001876 [Dendroctonus ponderosae]